MGLLRSIALVCLMALASASRAQDRLALFDQKHGDTLTLDAGRVLEVRSDSLWLYGALASWDAEQLIIRMKRYKGQYLVDTLLAVPKMEVRELLYCRLKDPVMCGKFDERMDRRDVWTNKSTCAVVLAGSLLFLLGDASLSRAGAVVAVGGGAAIYGGGKLLAKRDSKRVKLGKRWKLL